MRWCGPVGVVPTTLPIIGRRRPVIDRIAPFKGSWRPLTAVALHSTAPRNPCISLKPLLLIDVDGVLSLFGFPSDERPAGRWLLVDGSPHFLSAAATENLLFLADDFEFVWCTGWEEKANEYLPHALGLPGPLPWLSFDVAMGPRTSYGHWKLAAIDAFAGSERPLAWIDDAHDEECVLWATNRRVPTLLVPTLPHEGLTRAQASALRAWARGGAANRGGS